MDLLSAMTTFLRVVDAKSLSKTAQSLRVTPAAVSRQLSALEKELGATLLVRTTRQVTVTEAGRRFYDHASRTVREAEDARASVRSDRSLSGLLTISAPTALGLGLIDVAVAELVASHRGLRVDLRLEDAPVDLLAEGVDIAVRAGFAPPDSAVLVAQPLAEGPRVVVASPAYLKRHGEPKHPSELARHEAVIHLHSGMNVGTWTLSSSTESVTVDVRGSFRTNALRALCNAAVAGAGVALLPRFLCAEDIEEDRLRALTLGGFAPSAQRIYALVRAEAKAHPRIRVAVDALRDTLAGHSHFQGR